MGFRATLFLLCDISKVFLPRPIPSFSLRTLADQEFAAVLSHPNVFLVVEFSPYGSLVNPFSSRDIS